MERTRKEFQLSCKQAEASSRIWFCPAHPAPLIPLDNDPSTSSLNMFQVRPIRSRHGSAHLGFPPFVEHTAIVLASQAQEVGDNSDPALSLVPCMDSMLSFFRVMFIATLRTCSLQLLLPCLLPLLIHSLNHSLPDLLRGLQSPGRKSYLSSFISRHRPLALMLQLEEVFNSSKSRRSGLCTFCFPCMEPSLLAD